MYWLEYSTKVENPGQKQKERAEYKREEIKKANRESHRIDHLPLLPSGPGGFGRSW
jgi:hypothetical protein